MQLSSECTLDNRRQPEPVCITMSGHQEDIDHWMRVLLRYTNSDGWSASVCLETRDTIKIYPRAIND